MLLTCGYVFVPNGAHVMEDRVYIIMLYNIIIYISNTVFTMVVKMNNENY